jgi:nucleoside-diphosphate-sugar epimerase
MSSDALTGSVALVTGASGFLGANLCRRLLAGGAQVHATSRSARTSDHARLRWWQRDLASEGSAQALVREIRPDVVFHLAGQVSAAPSASLVMPAFQSLLASTVNLLTAVAEQGGARLVVTGSLTEPRSSSDLVVPSSPYAAAKWASTAYARMFHALYGTPVVILRPFMAYGPGQNPEKLVPHVILSLLRGTPPKLASGRWSADWVYVDDVIDGFVLAARYPGIDGATVDLGSGVLTSTREIVLKLVAQIDPRAEPQFGAVPDRPAEEVRLADLAAAKAALGWEPRTPLDQGLAQTIAWYRTQAPRSGARSEP